MHSYEGLVLCYRVDYIIWRHVTILNTILYYYYYVNACGAVVHDRIYRPFLHRFTRWFYIIILLKKQMLLSYTCFRTDGYFNMIYAYVRSQCVQYYIKLRCWNNTFIYLFILLVYIKYANVPLSVTSIMI